MNRLILLCIILKVSCISDAVRMDWVIPCAFQHKLIPNTHYGTKIQFFYNGNNSECFNKCYHITESSLNANTNLTCIGKNITLFNMEFSLNNDYLNGNQNENQNNNTYSMDFISFSQFIKHIFHSYEAICNYHIKYKLEEAKWINSGNNPGDELFPIAYNPPPDPFLNFCKQNEICCQNVNFDINIYDKITLEIYNNDVSIYTNTEKYYLGYTSTDISFVFSLVILAGIVMGLFMFVLKSIYKVFIYLLNGKNRKNKTKNM